MANESPVFLSLQEAVNSQQLDQRRCRVLQREGYQGLDYPFSLLLKVYLKSQLSMLEFKPELDVTLYDIKRFLVLILMTTVKFY